MNLFVVLKRRFTNETGLREGVIQVENHPGLIFLRSDLENGTEPFAFLSNLGETNVTALVVIRNYTAKYPVPGTSLKSHSVAKSCLESENLITQLRKENRRDRLEIPSNSKALKESYL